MALRKNVSLRDSQANHLADLWDGGTLEIRTGSQPADPGSAASGTLLGTITLPTPAFGASSSGAVNKIGTWTAVAVATGTAGWARMKTADSSKNMDLSVAETAADCIIDFDDITTGINITVISLTLTIPSGV